MKRRNERGVKMEKDLVIGIDTSTTACKALIWDLEGRLISQGRAEIPLLRPKPDWHEQEAKAWWDALTTSLRIATKEIDPDQLAGLCICPQRETFVPVDKDAKALRPAILWMDVRAQEFLPDLDRYFESGEFHRITGKPLSGNLTVLKMRWLRENEAGVFSQTSKFLDVAAYLNYHLTGIYATGWGIAAPAGLFDMNANNWSEDVLDYLQVRVDQMPEAYPAGAVIGRVRTEAAVECGLPVRLPVFAGLGDGQAGGLGLNITKPGACYLSLGTSVVSGSFTDTFVTDRTFRTMYAGVPGSYSLETVILGGTYTIDWFLAQFGQGCSLESLEEEIRDLPAGADGLLLLPYWNSVLNPYWDPAASGMVLGWRGHHGRSHLYRAILEGMAFELRLHFEGVEEALGREIEQVALMGGGSRSRVWCQIIADVTGKPIYRSDTSEATALGAGVIAACGAGLFPDFQTAATAMSAPIQEHFLPRPNQARQYSQLYREVYRKLFPAVQGLMRCLEGMTKGDQYSGN